MRAINVILAVVVSLLLGLGIFEGGLRLLGMGPKQSINRFDEKLGWSKRPGADSKFSTPEFKVRFAINQDGLRDDEDASAPKADDGFRVIMLGDSFVLGYTVNRDDLFVDLCEKYWQDEGRRVEVVNAGTEGWSTDQAVLWFAEHGERYSPDLVVLFPYENDLFWNGQTAYSRFPKPRFAPDGSVEARTLEDPGGGTWVDRLALANAWKRLTGSGSTATTDPARWSPDGHTDLAGPRLEWAAYFTDQPEFMRDALERTGGALKRLQKDCAARGAELVVAPIPNKACVDPSARQALEKAVGADGNLWSPDQPVDAFLGLASGLGIATLDARETLRNHYQNSDTPLYFERDWHFNAAGNRVFARFLTQELASSLSSSGVALTAAAIPDVAQDAGEVPFWLYLFGALWLVLGTGYAFSYRDESPLFAFVKVGGMLATIFVIAVGGSRLVGSLPPTISRVLLIAFVIGVIGFIAYKLGRRLATITELIGAFVRRGHWYLMPLVVVLLTVGSLLVVAASSPLAAPFIYTLF